ncbi:BatD family protein [Chryseobacterium gwangjuense]|uniref:BatD family protein n=1 Tax=Chryseobacterium gwangjuense TaxID=1069980 RepID=UPI001E401161|nr:BatD family protein [Chryseobacterium gwangjuense]MCE3076412.1 BatD family protein [Chryseobacterium gwangjuense]
MKQKLIYILLLFISIISYGQVSLSLEPDKTEYNGREIVNLTIVLELNGSELMQQTGFQLPDLSKFNLIGSGSVTNSFMDPVTNTVITEKITRLALEPKKKGKIKIGSVLVTVSNRIYKTEPFDILVKDIEKKSSAHNTTLNEVYLNMEIEDREIYQDQPTIAVLKVYSRNIDNLRKVRNIQLPQQDNINVHPVHFRKSEIDPSDMGGNMASQVVAVFMVFPNEAGYIEVPAVSASVNTLAHKNKILSNKVKLNVKKLPEGSPESFKNAVGNFKVDVYCETKEKAEIEKPIHVVVKVSGEGNITDMILPGIEASPDYEFFTPKITSKVYPGKVGMKGEIFANYIVVPKKRGDIVIKTEDFSFFDPEEKEYIDVPVEQLSIHAFSHEQVLESRTTVEKVNEYTNNFLETVNTPVLKTTSFKVKEKNKFNWNVLFVNIAILLSLVITYLVFRNWQKKRSLVKKTVSPHSLGSVAETEKEIRATLKTDITDYFNYLKNLKENNEYFKFFETVEELDSEVRNQYFQSSSKDFNVFLENYKGLHIAEEYRNLAQKIQIEKYTPVKSEEGIDELFNTIVNLYSRISK